MHEFLTWFPRIIACGPMFHNYESVRINTRNFKILNDDGSVQRVMCRNLVIGRRAFGSTLSRNPTACHVSFSILSFRITNISARPPDRWPYTSRSRSKRGMTNSRCAEEVGSRQNCLRRHVDSLRTYNGPQPAHEKKAETVNPFLNKKQH